MPAAVADVDRLVQAAAGVLARRIRLRGVVLFGSQLEGGADEWSDVDIAVFSPDVVGMKLLERARLAAEVQLACGLELEPHFFPDTYLDNPPEASFAKHIIETGRRIV